MDEFNHSIAAQLALAPDISIVKIVDLIISHACGINASDVHIDPQEKSVRIRFRIDGILEDARALPNEMYPELISRIKVLAHLRTDEHNAAQDGRFRSATITGAVDVRVSIVPTYHGENAVMRLLANHSEELTLESLGFSKTDQQKILHAVKKPTGMILVTGPTGSGKTTTLYALIKTLNSADISIVTIEDPIEYAVDGIEQIQVNARTGLTFANGLRSILRQDPNVIMVGEIRDTETASIAINTALTGHLLLSTLHTNDAATTLPRLLDMKIEPFLVSSTVSLVIGQRLVRTICTTCKKPKTLSEEEYLSLSELIPENILGEHIRFYEGRGCDECNGTGYKGRISINEVLAADEDIRAAILLKVSAREIHGIAVKNGMVTMLADGFNKALAGATTLQEVLRATRE